MQALGEAVAKLVNQCDWNGHIGIGMPGRVQDFGSLSASDWAAGRASRAALERLLEGATGCRVVAMGGAEAAGYGEAAYGAAKDSSGLVMMAVVGAGGFGIALFEDGVLVRGVDVRSILASWSSPGAAQPPPPGEAGTPAQWAAWSERVDRVLLQLDSVLHPQKIILGGSAARSAGVERLISLLTVAERVPVRPAALAMIGAVKGAAWGAAREFRTREALQQVRLALGAQAQASPAGTLSLEQLRAVFDQFAAAPGERAGAPPPGAPPPGSLSLGALGDMLRALAVDVAGEGELLRVFQELDPQRLGGISWSEWSAWWAQNVAQQQSVQLLLGQEEFNAVVLREATPGQLLCLEVGMTFCRPCKSFEKTFKAVAAEYPQVRFLRINGNENRSCTALARDVLGIRSTPAFYFFRQGSTQPVASHTGANEPKLREALEALLAGRPPAAQPAAAAAAAAPPSDPSKIDTRGAHESGLAALLQLMSTKQKAVERAKQQLRAAEAELEALTIQLQQTTGTAPGRRP